MRLDELTLERYGVYDQRTLRLDGSGLTVIYGPNEAGKSTCLEAVGDFLFGIPPNTARGAIYGYDSMRLGAALSLSDGRKLSLRRRKGRAGKTLSDDSGAAVEEGVLAAVLGATTRHRFERLFGLDHEGLRHGGEQLLAADGEIGRLIVEAGGGLRTLMGRLDAIDKEADQLFDTRRSNTRAFYKALDAYDVAERAGKADLLTRDVYEQTRKAHGGAVRALVQAREDRRQLAVLTSGLERLERVVPLLRQLDGLEARLGSYGDLPELAADFDLQWLEARRARDEAIRVLKTAQEQYDDLRGRIDTVQVNEALAKAEAGVRDIAESVVLVSRQRQDRPNRLKEIADGEGQLTALRQRLSLGADHDLAPCLPGPDVLDQAQRLAVQAIERRPALVNASSRMAELEDSVEATRRKLQAGRDAGYDKLLGISASAFVSLAAQASSADLRARQVANEAQAGANEVLALGLDTAALRHLPCPTLEQIDTELNTREELKAERVRQIAIRSTATAERDAAAFEVDRMRKGEEVATDAALAAARRERDAALTPIRDAHLSGKLTAPDEQRAREVETFDLAASNADRLSDRRTWEAQRVAALVEAERRVSAASAAIAASEAAEQTLSQTLEDRVAAFSRSSSQAIELWPELPALRRFVQTRQELVRRLDEIAETERDVERLKAELAPTLELLIDAEAKLGPATEADAKLVVRVQRVSQLIAEHEGARAEHLRTAATLEQQEVALSVQKRLLAGLQRDDTEWRAAWGPAVVAIGLPANATPELGNELATRWIGAAGVLTSLDQARRRLRRMDEDEAALRSRVLEVAQPLAISLPDDLVASAKMLQDRWRENDAHRLKRYSLSPELDGMARALSERKEDLVRTQAVLSQLASEAGVPVEDEAAVTSIASRHRARIDLVVEAEQLNRTISSAGDSLDPTLLREQSTGRELDEVRADLASARERTAELDHAIEASIQEEQRTRLVLNAHEGETAVNRAVVERESATAQMHGVLERYVELKLARELVSTAIQKVRTEQQDPLVRRAGILFALTTRGEFEGIETDIDEKGQPVVVGVRTGGGSVSVSAMSDGTRDQLFLSFRLASLENYCQATEPLPFVADDILVHFDDARGAATLELLAGFSSTTQVLLFTHHLSVRHAAERLVEKGGATIIDLGATAAAPALVH